MKIVGVTNGDMSQASLISNGAVAAAFGMDIAINPVRDGVCDLLIVNDRFAISHRSPAQSSATAA